MKICLTGQTGDQMSGLTFFIDAESTSFDSGPSIAPSSEGANWKTVLMKSLNSDNMNMGPPDTSGLSWKDFLSDMAAEMTEEVGPGAAIYLDAVSTSADEADGDNSVPLQAESEEATATTALMAALDLTPSTAPIDLSKDISTAEVAPYPQRFKDLIQGYIEDARLAALVDSTEFSDTFGGSDQIPAQQPGIPNGTQHPDPDRWSPRVLKFMETDRCLSEMETLRDLAHDEATSRANGIDVAEASPFTRLDDEELLLIQDVLTGAIKVEKARIAADQVEDEVDDLAQLESGAFWSNS